MDPFASKAWGSLGVAMLLACARPSVPGTFVAPEVAAGRAPRVITIDQAWGLDVAAHGSGDAIVLSETSPRVEPAAVFVTRVGGDGSFRWARRFEHREVSRLPGGRHAALLAVDAADRIFVASLAATRLARGGEPLEPWPAIGPTPCRQVHRPIVVALDDDGDVRWVHDFPSLGPTPVDAAPMAIAPDESGGVYVAMVHLRGSAIAHIAADGSLHFWRELTASPTAFADACSMPGWRLDSVMVPLLVRAGDGSVLAGGFTTVPLAIDGHTLAGERRFWLSLAETGDARWLREIAELPMDASTLAHYRGPDAERVVELDREQAANGSVVFELSREIAELSTFAAVDPHRTVVALNGFYRGVHHIGAERFEITTLGVPSRSVAVVAVVGGGRIERGALFHGRGRRDGEEGSVAVLDLAITPSGEILALGIFDRALELDGERVETPPQLRPCPDGEAGHEVSRPPDCTLAEDVPALFLARLPPFDR